VINANHTPARRCFWIGSDKLSDSSSFIRARATERTRLRDKSGENIHQQYSLTREEQIYLPKREKERMKVSKKCEKWLRKIQFSL